MLRTESLSLHLEYEASYHPEKLDNRFCHCMLRAGLQMWCESINESMVDHCPNLVLASMSFTGKV